MSEQTQAKIMQWIESAAQKIGEFATDQIPPFINEFLTWKFSESLIDIVLYLAIFTIMMYFTYSHMKKLWLWGIKETFDSAGPEILAPMFISVCLYLPFVCMFPLQQVKDCVEIKLAPKVYLIDYAAKTIKK